MNWYALQTHPNHEQSVRTLLDQREIENYLPLLREKRRWSDRRKVVEFPLFRGYVFIRCEHGDADTRFRILNLPGVTKFVCISDRTPAVIPDCEVDLVRNMVDRINSGELLHSDVATLIAGCTVEILTGAFFGYRGTFQREKHGRAVISIETANKKISAELWPEELQRIPTPLKKAA